MTIYEMTATFGKLEHETLTLKPGLNIIEAPNEWGKSTWCAFLVAMLYGIDTRERTTQDSLAVKERYAPWGGSPMSGRIDLCWEGRDITIERSTRGRSILGCFRAYETATGLQIPELNAENCGQLLLGVEKSVFTRAGFIKLTDLPVTQDERLRRRLNALVTTADESGASDALAQKLRDLKNQCRANRSTGLIPKAEAQRAELEEKFSKICELRDQCQRIQSQQEALSEHISKLENHRVALNYAAAQEQVQKAAAAQLHLERIREERVQLQTQCDGLPGLETLYAKLGQLEKLRVQKEELQMQVQLQTPVISAPEPPAAFRGCSGEEAVEQARQDQALYEALQSEKKGSVGWLVFAGAGLLLAGVVCLIMSWTVPAVLLMAAGGGGLIGGTVLWSGANRKSRSTQLHMERLLERYRSPDPSQWVLAARQFARSVQEYEENTASLRSERMLVQEQLQKVNAQLSALTEGASYIQKEQQWRKMLERYQELEACVREQQRTEELIGSLSADRQLPQPPAFADTLSCSQQETDKLLADAELDRHQLQRQLGHCQGQMESLGLEEVLQQQLQAVNTRLRRLEDTYSALEMAQTTLQEASKELQRRFAPRISRRTQELFGEMTANRYDRLTLGEDLRVSAGAQGEDTLHTALWRSDGTVDQLYLALRLAVAEELTPDAPLILDDALVRFDDTRLASAMEILEDYAKSKQVILFSCQGREGALGKGVCQKH